MTEQQPSHGRLFFFLSVATFFEGFDFIALSQVLPSLAASFDLSPTEQGLLFGAVNAGTIAAFWVIRWADRFGRRRVLFWTILGYTLCTVATGLAVGPWSFAILQFFARIFLLGEWATCNVYAAEVFPAESRGTKIGVLQGVSSLGAIACAGLTPLLLALPWGWRSVYFAGAVPLLALAWARRNLPETARFEALDAGEREGGGVLAVLRSPWRGRALQLALIWAATYVCSNTAISFWKTFVVAERGFTDALVGKSQVVAALFSLPLVFLSGHLLDRLGRRRGSVLIFVTTAVSVFGAYSARSPAVLTLSLAGAIFGVSAVLPPLNAWSTELFPTHLRSSAYGLANNLLGRLGYVAAPVLVGAAAERIGWGAAVAPTALSLLVALVLILRWMPETKGQELEEAARLG